MTVETGAHGSHHRARRAAPRRRMPGVRDRLAYVAALACFGVVGWWLNPHVRTLIGTLPDVAAIALDVVVTLVPLVLMTVPKRGAVRGAGGVLMVLVAPGFITHAFMRFGGGDLISELVFDFALSVEMVFFIGVLAVLDGVDEATPAGE